MCEVYKDMQICNKSSLDGSERIERPTAAIVHSYLKQVKDTKNTKSVSGSTEAPAACGMFSLIAFTFPCAEMMFNLAGFGVLPTCMFQITCN